MGWKNWPYWLKGGLIGDLIVIIGGLLTLLLSNIFPPFGLLWLPFLIILVLPVFFLCAGDPHFDLCSVGYLTGFWYLFVLLVLVECFIIGAIIGLIVGKIKSKK